MARKVAPLVESHPEVAARWLRNEDEDDRRTPADFSIKARLDCWWWCGNGAHAQFLARPGRHLHRFNCPHCNEDRGRKMTALLAMPVKDVPQLVEAWRDPRPYDGLTVEDLCAGVSGQNAGLTYALRCPEGHKVDTVARSFVWDGCPWCNGNTTRKKPRDSIATADPELAAIFHPTRNGELTAETTPINHRHPLWWKSVQCCGYEWQETITNRTLGRRPQAGRGYYYCPRCETTWGSLAWLDPELAAEWHPDNPLTPWHVKPFSGGVTAKWRCSVDPTHEWTAPVGNRSSGALCPQCSMAGTSMIEKAFLAAAQAFDPAAEATRLGRWRVDVFIPSVNLVIEYDGEYWHRSKEDLDTRKTLALLDLGHLVARVRENDLPPLDLDSPRVRQVTFHPAVGRPDAAVASLVDWARTHTEP